MELCTSSEETDDEDVELIDGTVVVVEVRKRTLQWVVQNVALTLWIRSTYHIHICASSRDSNLIGCNGRRKEGLIR